MALDELQNNQDNNEDSNSENLKSESNTPLTNINPNAPAFVKDIVTRKGSMPINMDVQYIPQNPYTMNGNDISYNSSQDIEGIKKHSSFLSTAEAEAYEWNNTAKSINATNDKLEESNIETPHIHTFIDTLTHDQPLDDIAPPDWNSKSDPSKFVNVNPENMSYILAATGPKDQDFRLQRVLEDQQHAETLANGSFAAKLIGGILGAATDPVSYIPIAGWAKYAKLAPTVMKTIGRVIPGAATYGTLAAAADQANKINGNMADFATQSLTNTVFGTALFATGGAVALTLDKMELWNLRNIATNYMNGIDYKLATNEKGIVNGYKAVDTTDSLSAQKVSFAQDLADSSFQKSGIFKIPYVGAGTSKLLAMKIPGTEFYFGSQLQSLLQSPFKTVRGFIDRVADHSLITKGVAEGEAAPKKFASLMQQSSSQIRALSVQIDALHLERNGFSTTNRPLGGLVNLGLGLKNTALKLLAKDADKSNYISREQFHSEIENVLLNENPSNHASVNEAAQMMRQQMDTTYTHYREAYNLPKDWLPPKTSDAYLMRVYDTPYMNNHENEWISSVSGWLKEADETINQRMQPINDMKDKITNHIQKHEELISRPNITDNQVKTSANELIAMKARKKSLEEQLQNELRTDPDMALHVDDWNALSADEAKEIEQLTKRQRIAEKEVNERKKIVQDIKDQIGKRESAALKGKTVKTAKGNKRKSETGELVLEQEQTKLDQVQLEYEEETEKLQQQMHNGEINSRLFTRKPDSFQYEFKNINDRLKLRDIYGSEKNPQTPEQHAKAYYDTIMNQTPEDTINQVMGKFNDNKSENPIKQRTLLIPDHVLYDGKFMSKDLMAKVANYTNYLSRRTHLKNVFNDVTHDGGIEPLLEELNNEHEQFRVPLNEKKYALEQDLIKPNQSKKDIDSVVKKIKSVEKELTQKKKDFEAAKNNMNHLYQKMMGIRKYSKGVEQARSVIMSLTAIANLPFVPFTQINDLSAIGLQHGIWPFIRDGIYPIIESLGGIRKSKESEAFRNTAPSVHLALQDVLNGYADRNWGMHTNPYLNLGKIVNTIEKVAHMSSNFTLTNYIDNGLQRITASVTQSELMRILHAFKNGTMSKRDGLYIRKYGIDPKKWSDRMIDAFEADGGGKTKLGGYQSLFYKWQDMEAANEFSQAVYRGVKDTQIQSGIADSPFWTDNPLGSIIKGFNGWTFASVNRYVIPSMQQPDAQKLLGVLFMLGTGALIDPMRRMARGEDAYPPNITDKQMMWSTINNSGYMSYFANTLADANVLTGDRLLGDLRSDKYKDRTRAGLLGPSWGSFNRLVDVIDAAGTGEWNKADMNKTARMLPFANATWTYWMSKKLIDSLNIPKNRAQAHALKGINQ